MSNCTVSILMPTLNSRLYLVERMETILEQTLADWELIVVDSYSTDGTWELLQKYAYRDPRLRITQAPKEGMYRALNRCLDLAQGQYVYVATSDDTMEPQCLQVMVAGLEAYPGCDLCHTRLRVIDEHSQEITGWWERIPVAEFYGELMDYRHIRLAPYDGILHCGLRTIYLSLTQLLIRRSLFAKVGYFRSDWGAESDFEWGMRASLVGNVLHLPEAVATWRIHKHQLTSQDTSAKRQMRFCQMVDAAISILRGYDPTFYHQLQLKRLLLPYQREAFLIGWGHCRSYWQKCMLLMQFMSRNRLVVYQFLWDYICLGTSTFHLYDYLRRELHRLGLESHVQVLHSD